MLQLTCICVYLKVQSLCVELNTFNFHRLLPRPSLLAPRTQPPPQLRPFNTENFLKSMEGTGPHLTTGIKGNWNGLYRKFLESPNFVNWYTVRKEEANQKLRLLHLDQLCKAVSRVVEAGSVPLCLEPI